MPVDESNEEVTERLREKIRRINCFSKILSKLPCVATVLKKKRWKLVTEKLTLPTSGRNDLKKMKNSCEKDLMKYLITWTGKVLLRTYKSSMRFKVVV